MTDAEPKKKKKGIVKAIFRWFFIVVFSILLIAGIYFQAPWKVLTLLAVLIAVLTIVPKAFRKWCWLGFGVIILALIVWVFLPEDNEGWRPYTFDDELAALEAKRAIPDEDNAAIIYNKLLETYDVNDFLPEFLTDELEGIISSESWSSKDHPQIADWLKTHENTIEILLQAGKKDDCAFPVGVDPLSFEVTMDRLGPMKCWAVFLKQSANNDLGDGRIDKAIEKYLTLLQMAQHEYQQPMLIEMLVGMAIEPIAENNINRLVITNEVTEEHLNIIEETLQSIKHDWSSDWPKILDHEKLFAKNMITMVLYETNDEGKTRFSRKPMTVILTLCPQITAPNYWKRKLFKAGAVLVWFFVPNSPQKIAEIIDEASLQYYAMAEPDFDRQKKTEKISFGSFKLNYLFVTKMLFYALEPPYYNIHDIYLQRNADHRGSRLIIGLRRYKDEHGNWPGSLDDISDIVPAEVFIDPVNNGEFVYRLTDDSFTLYSRGKNDLDEDGQNRKWDFETEKFVNEGKDDILIWPQKSRKQVKSESRDSKFAEKEKQNEENADGAE